MMSHCTADVFKQITQEEFSQHSCISLKTFTHLFSQHSCFSLTNDNGTVHFQQGIINDDANNI